MITDKGADILDRPLWRRERVAEVQLGARKNDLRYDSAYSGLRLRDAEIAAHAAFRRQLYDFDVLPQARPLHPSWCNWNVCLRCTECTR